MLSGEYSVVEITGPETLKNQESVTRMIRDDHHLLGIHIDNREKQAVEVQKLLTTYGDSIKTRLGLHETGAGNGLIILEMADETSLAGLKDELAKLDGVDSQGMTFSH